MLDRDRAATPVSDISEETLACSDKVVFATRKHAKLAASRKPGRTPYKCPHCRKWHVGSDIFRTGSRERRNREMESEL